MSTLRLCLACSLLLTGHGIARDRSLIAGKVVFADGSVPQELVEVGLVCNGVEQPRIFPNAQGRFRLRPPEGQQNCVPRAYLPGYVSDGPALGSTNVALKPLGKQPPVMKSSRDKDASKQSHVAFENALRSAGTGDLKEAEAWFEESKTLSPWFASAWYNLGVLQERRGDLPSAKNAFKEALKNDDVMILARLHAAIIEVTRQDWQEALDDSKRILADDPVAFPRAYLLNAQANLNMHHTDDAEKSAREGIKLDPENRYPELHYILGLLLIDKGDRPGAIEQLSAYLKLDSKSPAAAEAREQLTHLHPSN